MMNPVPEVRIDIPNDISLREVNMDPKLFAAATQGRKDDVISLVEDDNSILQQTTHTNDTVIHIAARHGHVAVLTYVLSKFPELLTRQNSKGDTPFHIAARAGDFDMLRHLTDYLKVSAATSPPPTQLGLRLMINRQGDTPMHDAVRSGQSSVVKELIGLEPLLLQVDTYSGESPLYLAAEKGESEIVEEILGRPNYSYNGPNRRNALHGAIIHGREAIAEILLKKNRELAKLPDNNKRLPLHFATTYGTLKLVKLLLKYDTSTTRQLLDANGLAPIHIAALQDNTGIVKEFLRRYPDLKEFLTGKGQNILHMAIERCSLHVIKYILRTNGFDGVLNEKDNIGNTPLHQATTSLQPYIVYLLVNDKRVDVQARNNEGSTALRIAMSETDESSTYEKNLVQEILLQAASPTWPDIEWVKESFANPISLFSVKWCKDKSNTLILVATLTATVAFAAAFTMPGGYYSEAAGDMKGIALFARTHQFQEFLDADAHALYYSIFAVIALFGVHVFNNTFLVLILFVAGQMCATFGLFWLIQAFLGGLELTTRLPYTLFGPSFLTWYSISEFVLKVYLPVVLTPLVLYALHPMIHSFLTFFRVYTFLRAYIYKWGKKIKIRNKFSQRQKDIYMLQSYQKAD